KGSGSHDRSAARGFLLQGLYFAGEVDNAAEIDRGSAAPKPRPGADSPDGLISGLSPASRLAGGWPRTLPEVDSEHPELELRGLRHPVRAPRRVEDDVDLGVRHARDAPDPLRHRRGQLLGGRAAGRGQRHPDPHRPRRLDGDAVDETQLVDVDRDFGVVHRTQGVHDELLQLGPVNHRCRLPSPHSVVTGSACPASGARTGCQGRVAHLIRLGNSRTPAKTASLPSVSVGSASAGAPVTIAWKRPNKACASATALPWSCAVIMDADALEMAHPEPWNAMSRITPSSTRSSTRIASPHRGLMPSACWVAWASFRKFLGFRL